MRRIDSVVNVDNVAQLLRARSPALRSHALRWLRDQATERLGPLAKVTVPTLDLADDARAVKFALAVLGEAGTRAESKPPSADGSPTQAERHAAQLLRWAVNCLRLDDPGEGWREMLLREYQAMAAAAEVEKARESAARARQEAKRRREAGRR